MNNTAKLAAIDVVYAAMPRLDCKGLCVACCTTFGMTPLEKKRIEARTGTRLITKRLPCATEDTAAGPGVLIGVHEIVEGQCPLLKDGRCSIYAIRPTICRLWGMTHRFQCPHGCEPERWLSDEEAGAIMMKIQQLSS